MLRMHRPYVAADISSLRCYRYIVPTGLNANSFTVSIHVSIRIGNEDFLNKFSIQCHLNFLLARTKIGFTDLLRRSILSITRVRNSKIGSVGASCNQSGCNTR
jgi:hypothetical protein